MPHQNTNAIFAALFAVDPSLPWILLAMATEIGLRFVRRLFPTQAKLTPAGWDLIPAALLAAGFAAATTEVSSLTLFFGAVMGILGPLLRTTPPTTPPPPPSPPVEATEQPSVTQPSPESAIWAVRVAAWTRGGPTAVLLLLVAGCQSQLPADEAEWQSCQALAVARFHVEAAVKCPADKPWVECQDAAALEQRLSIDLEACNA